MNQLDLDFRCINTIRSLSIDAIQKANSGHPGLPLGAAPMAYVLWCHLKQSSLDLRWPDRDRFVLSPGHGSMLLYSLLHLSGHSVSMDDLKAFRQWGSQTPGHPEAFLTPGVEATTGPLGQGAANAVGMAMAERKLAHLFNRPGHEVVDHFTYAIVSDGDLMEGVSAEAASLAGHLKLGKLICLYDANDITLDGSTALAFSSEDVGKRYESYGWQVIHVENGDHDLPGIDRAIVAAKTEKTRPSLIIVKTTIGFGAPKAGTSSVHGSPLGVEGVAATKKALKLDPEKSFDVPADVSKHFASMAKQGAALYEDWKRRWEAWASEYPDLATQWKQALAGELPTGWEAGLPTWKAGEKIATRSASGKVLNVLASRVPWLIGGDADLSVSTSTGIKDAGSFDGQTGAGRNIHYGVREHAMAAAANGMAYHGGLKSYTATFFCFSDYMRPSVRLAAMNHLPVIHVWTHDSIGLGEDGPTHQPVEQLMALRAMPGLCVIRPCDGNEAAAAWRVALQRRNTPVGLVLTRQDLPVLDRSKYASADFLEKGAYVLSEAKDGRIQAILIATGSEVQVALEAQALLEKDGIYARVVSMPSFELFEEQSAEYRESVLPRSVVIRISVEAGVTLGWERYIGLQGAAVGLDRYGASAPAKDLMARFGFTGSEVALRVRQLIKV